MAKIRGDNHAFGWPGLEPRWTHGDKDGIGTAYSAASRSGLPSGTVFQVQVTIYPRKAGIFNRRTLKAFKNERGR
jgi:hypothetical protein